MKTEKYLDVSGHVSLAPQSNLGDSKLKPGDRVPAMVLFVDYQVRYRDLFRIR